MESKKRSGTPDGESETSTIQQDVIGKKLKDFYQEVVRQPLPSRFSELLDELERKSTQPTEKK